MADVYEFRIRGRIGPVVRSAFPELETTCAVPGTRLNGRGGDAAEVCELLHRLDDEGLIATDVLMTRTHLPG